MKCPHCNGDVVPVARFGRSLRYRNIPNLPVPAELRIPTCSECDKSYVDSETAAQLDRALAPAYDEELRHKAKRSLEILAEQGITQRSIEPLLGLSAGYLSKVRRGKETSASLVSILMLLASDPAMMSRLQQLWQAGAEVGPQPKDYGLLSIPAGGRPVYRVKEGEDRTDGCREGAEQE